MKTKYYVKKDSDYDLLSFKAVTFKLRILLSIEILKSIMKQINYLEDCNKKLSRIF